VKSKLKLKTESEKRLWVEESRVQAILGSAPRSLPTIFSGIRTYVAFIGKTPRTVFLPHRNNVFTIMHKTLAGQERKSTSLRV